MRCVIPSQSISANTTNFYTVYFKVYSVGPLEGAQIKILKFFNTETNNFVSVCSVAYLSSVCNTILTTDSNGIAEACLTYGLYTVSVSYNGYVNYYTIQITQNQEVELPFFFEKQSLNN